MFQICELFVQLRIVKNAYVRRLGCHDCPMKVVQHFRFVSIDSNSPYLLGEDLAL